MFEFDGDVKAVRHVLYNCSANRPTITGETTTNTKEPQPNELTFIASARPGDLAVKTKTTADTTKEVYDNWYKEVYEKYGEDRKSTRLNSSHVAISYAVF